MLSRKAVDEISSGYGSDDMGFSKCADSILYGKAADDVSSINRTDPKQIIKFPTKIY